MDRDEQKSPTLFSYVIGIIGLSVVVLVHECGHFIVAQLCGVATPVFSIGFGPALVAYKIGNTLFQIALLPIGGYVAMSPYDLDALPYIQQMAIMLAGIVSNIIFAYLLVIASVYDNSIRDACRKSFSAFKEIVATLGTIPTKILKQEPKRSIIGPIGIIAMVGKSFFYGKRTFLLMLIFLNINIALFNVLPLPILDGGKVVTYTIRAMTASMDAGTAYVIMLVITILLLLCIITAHDSYKRKRNIRR